MVTKLIRAENKKIIACTYELNVRNKFKIPIDGFILHFTGSFGLPIGPNSQRFEFANNGC